MSKKKAFWFSFLITLAALAPLYLGVLFYARLSNAGAGSAADTPQSGVWIAQATRGDARTVLLMTGDGTAQSARTFALVRFDAFENALCVAAFPAETVVLQSGAPLTLAEAVGSAGPSQAVACLCETLDIEIDDYLFCSPATLWGMAEGLGTARLRLENYMSAEALGALQLDVAGAESQTLTPRLLAEVLASGGAPQQALCTLRAKGYAAFLSAGAGRLADVLPAALRANSTKLATNISATDIYSYERIFAFLDRQQPEVNADAPGGIWAGGKYELGEDAAAFAAQYLK